MNYVKFTMCKENKETIATLNAIASKIRCKPKVFAIAGTKDKRGVTVQHVTAYRVEPKKLKNLNGKIPGVALGNFEFAKEPLELGKLSGNRFGIILRNINCGVANIEKMISMLSSVGFINYFGMQRFGQGMFPTSHVGKLLIKGDWQGIRDCLVGSRNGLILNESEKWKLTWDETKCPYENAGSNESSSTDENGNGERDSFVRWRQTQETSMLRSAYFQETSA